MVLLHITGQRQTYLSVEWFGYVWVCTTVSRNKTKTLAGDRFLENATIPVLLITKSQQSNIVL